MNEEFLFYIWQYRLFDTKELSTVQGEPVEIIRPGDHNSDSGPDFFNARIKLGDTQWAGNIEVHTRSSDWKKHRHQGNKAYDNIILHVVHEEDEPVFRQGGEAVPTLELKHRIPGRIYSRYLQFKSSKAWVPCGRQAAEVSKFTLHSWLDRVLAERLERKANMIEESLAINKYNWEETFYRHMARSFGFKVNGDPFELLAGSLPSTILARHKDNLFQLEALLFGQAGLLETTFREKYPTALQNEYHFLKKKFRLSAMPGHLWKFMRMRPSNFPTLRIAQFASLVNRSSHLFSRVMETESLAELRKLLDVNCSDYWQGHYRFGKKAPGKRRSLGEDAVDIIIINTVVPFLFLYGKHLKNEKYSDRAFQYLEETEAEKNGIISRWEQIGLRVRNAYDTQALLQLKNEYCDKKRCLNCAIGNDLMRSKN